METARRKKKQHGETAGYLVVAAGSTAAVVCGLWSFCGRLSHLLFEVHTQDDEFWIEKDTKIASASGSRSVRGGGRPIHPPWGGVGGVCVCARALALITCTAYCYSKNAVPLLA